MIKTISDAVAVAFQVSQTIPLKTAKYGEATAPSFGLMAPNEVHMWSIDVLAKVGRLPLGEKAVLTARYAATTEAINLAADLLPKGWPTAMRRELARGWARSDVVTEGQARLERSQTEMADTYLLSQQTMSRRVKAAFSTLSRIAQDALDVLEVQMLSEVSRLSRKNAHRRACNAQ